MVGTSLRPTLISASLWLGLPILVTCAGLFLNHSALLMLYLCAVLYTALHTGKYAVLGCAALSFLLFNFFHTSPRFSLQMRDPDELIAAMVFVAFALLAGTVASRLQTQLARLQVQRQFLHAQVQLNRELQDLDDEAAIPKVIDSLFQHLFPGLVFDMNRFAGAAGSDSVLVLQWNKRQPIRGDDDLSALLASLQEQIQNTLVRMRTARDMHETERRNDEEKLRSALLASVSHDLKTPLVTMMGAATSLRDLETDLSRSDRDALLESIISESQRLESYIQNLLDMTRLGHGELGLSRAWISASEIYHVVIRRIARQFPAHRVRLQQHSPLPLLYVHSALIEQGLYNVIENALKAGGNSEVLVEVLQKNEWLILQICDHGPGLPHSEWETVFDQFYTFSLGDRYEKGTGLGLSICRSIFRVHGGDALIIPAPAGFTHCVELSLPVVDDLRALNEAQEP